jgi:uncharacterized protein YcnI
MRTAIRASLLAAGLLAVGAAQAGAHATITPAVAPSGQLQQYSLSVPTEKEGATTKTIALTVPVGFAVDSYEAAPGWKRTVAATGSGENAVVHTITWTGGKVPTDEDSVFRMNASATKAKDYRFTVRQTYSDGSVVDWSGPESSDSPAPTVNAISDFGGGGGGSSTLAVIALVVGLVALGLAGAGLAGGRGGSGSRRSLA